MDCSVFERRGSEHFWWEIKSPLLRTILVLRRGEEILLEIAKWVFSAGL